MATDTVDIADDRIRELREELRGQVILNPYTRGYSCYGDDMTPEEFDRVCSMALGEEPCRAVGADGEWLKTTSTHERRVRSARWLCARIANRFATKLVAE
jgi:hypothetical protein